MGNEVTWRFLFELEERLGSTLSRRDLCFSYVTLSRYHLAKNVDLFPQIMWKHLEEMHNHRSIQSPSLGAPARIRLAGIHPLFTPGTAQLVATARTR